MMGCNVLAFLPDIDSLFMIGVCGMGKLAGRACSTGAIKRSVIPLHLTDVSHHHRLDNCPSYIIHDSTVSALERADKNNVMHDC